jgi:hypothetical protein
MQPMNLAAAREVLGIDTTMTWPDVRATYLRLMRAHHPDTAEDLADAGVRTLRTAQITEAFAVVVGARAAHPEPPTPPPGTPVATGAVLRHPTTGPDETRSLLLDAPPGDAFLALHEVFSVLGAVSYLDRLSLVLETIVLDQPGRATSLLAWLDPAPDDVTAVTVGVESLGGHAPADLDVLVDRIAALLASPRPPATEH